MAWFGEQMQEGIGMKVAELNAAGGVLGQQIALLPVDDYCDPEQAVAAARKLVEAQVDAVIGHLCSGAAIPASRIYEDAGILFFGSSATNPKLTEQGFRTVFRIAGRDTREGVMAADYLAKRWSDHNIAIVHDGGAYGLGVAEAARRRLSELGVRKVTFLAIEPGQTDYFDLIDQLRAKNIDVLFFCGYYAEAGLIIRQARSHGYGIRMIGPDTLNTEFFWRVAGEASEGVLFPSNPELRNKPEAAPLVARFRAKGYEPEGITLADLHRDAGLGGSGRESRDDGAERSDRIAADPQVRHSLRHYRVRRKGRRHRLRALRMVRLAGRPIRAGRPGGVDRVMSTAAGRGEQLARRTGRLTLAPPA